MRTAPVSYRGICLLGLVFLLAPLVLPQDKPKEPEDPQKKWVTHLAQQARADIRRFEQSKKKKPGEESPARKWAEIIWQYRLAHPGTPAADEAAREALWLLIRPEFHSEFVATLDTLKPEDSAWQRVFPSVYAVSRNKQDPDWFIQKLQAVLPHMKDKKARATAGLYLGRSYLDKKDQDKAKAVFETAAQEAPDSEEGDNVGRNSSNSCT